MDVLKEYTVIEKHAVYLTFKVEAKSCSDAIDKANGLMWDDANNETTEFENSWCVSETGEELLDD